ncbi:MAG: citramalate synthase [Aigarchaeota archaeon]|nr:citramalate synthase [Aigarchaeota archaeon]
MELLDTTLRDGAQTRGVSLTLLDKIRIVQKLDELGIDIIEGGWPGSNPKDSEFFKVVKNLGLSSSRIAAFGSTRRKGIRARDDPSLTSIVETDVPIAVIFGKSWPLHVREVLNCTLEENLDMVAESVEFLRDHGIEVIFDAEHFFDGYKQDPGYTLKVIRVAEEAGASTVTLCDTNGGSLMEEVREATRAASNSLKCRIGIHTHNDAGLAVANTLVAVSVGARHIQGTMIGLGERCGNADLSQLIPTLALKMGYSLLGARLEERLKLLTPTARFISDVVNVRLADNWPYVGRNAFAHKAGVHIDAMLKNPRTYEHIDPALIGNERRISISELAGRSTIQYMISKMGYSDLERGVITKILDEVKRLEARGYHLESADGTVELLIMRNLGVATRHFSVLNWTVEVQGSEQTKAASRVTIEVNGEVLTEEGIGVGPVHALDNALRNALLKKFPSLEDTKLADYRVTVVDSVEGTAAAVRVFVEFVSTDKRWCTTSVSRNIIDASLNALVDGYTYKLIQEKRKKDLPQVKL